MALAAVADDGRADSAPEEPPIRHPVLNKQNQEGQRLGIPVHQPVNGDVIRFSIEEVFRWEAHHLHPCRSGPGTPVDALQSASS
ncbi:MAG: hypothetical protein NDI91_08275 [Sulfuritalea sp.]|nr:hypothetical protein [Sulfuritalea sp.]